MPATSLQQLFEEELRDIYDGEKRLLRALPKMAKAAESGELQAAFTSHAKETQKQVTRLEQVFRAIGKPARGKKCTGIMGIVEEGNHAIEELDGSVLDAALIAGAQKVEHYEIATYGTLAYFADLLGEHKAKDLLGETLDEEKAADEKLSKIAKSDVNCDALMRAGGHDDASAAGSGVTDTVRRAVASLGLVNSRPAKRRSSGGTRSKGAAARRKRTRR